jgi:hypothetical protein
MLFNVGFGPIRGASGLLKELNRVIRAIFYHACASTAVEIATVHSHPWDTRGKREGHMRDTSEGGDTDFYGMPTPVFGTGVGTEKVSPWVLLPPPPGCHGDRCMGGLLFGNISTYHILPPIVREYSAFLREYSPFLGTQVEPHFS